MDGPRCPRWHSGAGLRKLTAVQRTLWLRITLRLHRAQGERSEEWARVEVLWTLAHPPCQMGLEEKHAWG